MKIAKNVFLSLFFISFLLKPTVSFSQASCPYAVAQFPGQVDHYLTSLHMSDAEMIDAHFNGTLVSLGPSIKDLDGVSRTYGEVLEDLYNQFCACTENAGSLRFTCIQKSGPVKGAPVKGSTCTSDAQCNDNNSCTEDSCKDPNGSGALVCVNNSIPFCTPDMSTAGTGGTPKAGGKCTNQIDCDDSNTCTKDSCNNGSCSHDPDPSAGPKCGGSAGTGGGPVKGTGGAGGGGVKSTCASAADCDDGVLCTYDDCKEVAIGVLGCTHQPMWMCSEGGSAGTGGATPKEMGTGGAKEISGCSSDSDCPAATLCTGYKCDIFNNACVSYATPATCPVKDGSGGATPKEVGTGGTKEISGCNSDSDCPAATLCNGYKCDTTNHSCLSYATPATCPVKDGSGGATPKEVGTGGATPKETGTGGAKEISGCSSNADCPVSDLCTTYKCDTGTHLCVSLSTPDTCPVKDGSGGATPKDMGTGGTPVKSSCSANTDCEDGNPCTENVCKAGTDGIRQCVVNSNTACDTASGGSTPKDMSGTGGSTPKGTGGTGGTTPSDSCTTAVDCPSGGECKVASCDVVEGHRACVYTMVPHCPASSGGSGGTPPKDSGGTGGSTPKDMSGTGGAVASCIGGCDDGDQCTKDGCKDGVCEHTDISAGNPNCAVAQTCAEGEIQLGDICFGKTLATHDPEPLSFKIRVHNLGANSYSALEVTDHFRGMSILSVMRTDPSGGGDISMPYPVFTFALGAHEDLYFTVKARIDGSNCKVDNQASLKNTKTSDPAVDTGIVEVPLTAAEREVACPTTGAAGTGGAPACVNHVDCGGTECKPMECDAGRCRVLPIPESCSETGMGGAGGAGTCDIQKAGYEAAVIRTEADPSLYESDFVPAYHAYYCICLGGAVDPKGLCSTGGAGTGGDIGAAGSGGDVGTAGVAGDPGTAGTGGNPPPPIHDVCDGLTGLDGSCCRAITALSTTAPSLIPGILRDPTVCPTRDVASCGDFVRSLSTITFGCQSQLNICCQIIINNGGTMTDSGVQNCTNSIVNNTLACSTVDDHSTHDDHSDHSTHTTSGGGGTTVVVVGAGGASGTGGAPITGTLTGTGGTTALPSITTQDATCTVNAVNSSDIIEASPSRQTVYALAQNGTCLPIRVTYVPPLAGAQSSIRVPYRVSYIQRSGMAVYRPTDAAPAVSPSITTPQSIGFLSADATTMDSSITVCGPIDYEHSENQIDFTVQAIAADGSVLSSANCGINAAAEAMGGDGSGCRGCSIHASHQTKRELGINMLIMLGFSGFAWMMMKRRLCR